MRNYILDEAGNPVLVADVEEWAYWFSKPENESRKAIARTEIGNMYVSTAFLGIDHSFGGPVPVLYETMIFGGMYDNYQERHYSKEEAIERHKNIVIGLILKREYTTTQIEF